MVPYIRYTLRIMQLCYLYYLFVYNVCSFDFNKVIYSGIPFISMLNLKSLVRQSAYPREGTDIDREIDVINRCIVYQRKGDTHSKTVILLL